VPAWIYEASYPVWFLSELSFREIFDQRYQLVCEYLAEGEPAQEGKVIFKGFQFEAKNRESSKNGGD
jgi:hypothetical protein